MDDDIASARQLRAWTPGTLHAQPPHVASVQEEQGSYEDGTDQLPYMM